MRTNEFIKIISNSLKDITKINETISKDNYIINNLSLDISFSPDSKMNKIKLANSNDLFMDKYKEKNYFKMHISASIK